MSSILFEQWTTIEAPCAARLVAWNGQPNVLASRGTFEGGDYWFVFIHSVGFFAPPALPDRPDPVPLEISWPYMDGAVGVPPEPSTVPVTFQPQFGCNARLDVVNLLNEEYHAYNPNQ